MDSGKKKQKNNATVWLIVLIVCMLLFLAGSGFLVWVFLLSSNGHGAYSPTHTVPSVTESDELPTLSGEHIPTETELPENPVDFNILKAENKDVYAWIFIPNTGIDLPIVQASPDEDDNLYLHRDINLKYDYKGMLYTQRANATDFRDRVTVIYGHNMLDGTMFSNLHMFRDPDFFSENEYFYIYTPEHILTYRIVSAFQYDGRHILNSFDFSDDAVFQDYLDLLLQPRSYISDIREGVTLSTDDRIVTLSTCIYHGAYRYLVQGVLILDEPTK